MQLLYQFLMTKLCQTFMITSWIVNWFEKHIRQIWNVASLLQLAYCQSLKCSPLTGTQARRHALGRDSSINRTINCTLLKAVPTVQQFLNFVNLWLVKGR